MKKTVFTIATITCLITASVILSSMSGGNSKKHQKHFDGADPGYCADPAGLINIGLFNDCTYCHSANGPITVSGWITTDIPVQGYFPDSTYTIAATCINLYSPKSGFEVSPQDSIGTMMGTITNLSDQTQLVYLLNGSDTVWYITHTAVDSGNLSSTSTKTWTFQWTAPSVGDTVIFYGAFNASNDDNTDGGDTIYLSTLMVTKSLSTGIPKVSNNSILNIYSSIVTDNMHISYTLPETQKVTISLVDISGRIGETLFTGTQNCGTQDLSFNLSDKYAAGIYFIRINAIGFNNCRKIVIL